MFVLLVIASSIHRHHAVAILRTGCLTGGGEAAFFESDLSLSFDIGLEL